MYLLVRPVRPCRVTCGGGGSTELYVFLYSVAIVLFIYGAVCLSVGM